MSPLISLTDPASEDFIAETVAPVLDAQGTGPATFTLTPPAGMTMVTFYVACAPASEFTVTMGSWFAGPCDENFQNSGGIPLAAEGDVTAELELPQDTRYWIVGVPSETSGHALTSGR